MADCIPITGHAPVKLAHATASAKVLRYPPTLRMARATKWAFDWRMRWFRKVGSVHQHYRTGELVAFFSDLIDPTDRLSLQAELEARPNGPAQVLAACRKIANDFNAVVDVAISGR